MDVYVSATKEAAASGGALLAKYAWWKQSNPDGSFEDMTGEAAMGLTCVAHPHKDIAGVYDGLIEVYDSCEDQVVKHWATKSSYSVDRS